MSKVDKLKQATSNSFVGLYPSNTPQQEPKADEPKIEPKVEKKDESKSSLIEKPSHRKYKMLSFRLPDEIIENVEKYAYVERLQKQEVVMKAFNKFFNSKEGKEILSQYDQIVGGR